MMRQRKSNESTENGMQNLTNVMMPNQLNNVLHGIDAMLAKANKTIDESLQHSAKLVEQAQQQLLNKHQHLAEANQQAGSAHQAANTAGNVTESATTPEPPGSAAQNPTNQSPMQQSSVQPGMAQNASQPVAFETELQDDPDSSAPQTLAKENSDFEEKLLQEQQQLVNSQEQAQQTTLAAQKTMQDALTQINQRFMAQQQAYEKAIMGATANTATDQPPSETVKSEAPATASHQ